MIRGILVFGFAWMATLPCLPQETPEPSPPMSPKALTLDAGLLDPEWFGQGPTWTHDWRADFLWARAGARLDPPAIHLLPWEEPRFPGGDLLDYARGGEAAEFLQALVRTRLKALPGIQMVASPVDTPYHAVGRVVEATHIRQGALATFGPFAGLPTQTWDFKLVDVRTNTTLIASHHRSVGAAASTWFTALEAPLLRMAGLTVTPWEMLPDSQELEGRDRYWVAPGFRLPPGTMEPGTWMAEADSGGLNKFWANGMGANLAAQTAASLRDRLTRSGLAHRGEDPAVYLLTGQLFSSLKLLKPRYRARMTEIATGRVVARYEILAPFSLAPGVAVAGRIAAHLETLREDPLATPVAGGSPGPVPPRQPLADWEGLERLAAVGGGVDRAWVSQGFQMKGRSLHVADWCPAVLGPEADAHDRIIAAWIGLRAPGWLSGALASYPDRGFRISRTGGDLRLEGRVVRLQQPDTRHFWTGLGGAMTFGLSLQAEGLIQVRILDAGTGATLALVERELISFQVASDGIPYKTMKWLAQDLVPWLLKEDGQLRKPQVPQLPTDPPDPE